ncbi:nucleotide exchange factor GrpE [Candidatus Anaplasma sp. TIGMIC]|uniref:nucleotide exchange factor GrpE n=1 Tax=Candidatus Anaplasma sp. TIGMIC TaxID=3020713 RepID=UPI00232E997C|nr:nucleotide exchange factor GrpE [Candidatus Anaplasma sp. TIGMIC]MDB1135349.1 nucleotide exchange factor GrpE [Candidatus Anaplasma sp. TIGMIC]
MAEDESVGPRPKSADAAPGSAGSRGTVAGKSSKPAGSREASAAGKFAAGINSTKSRIGADLAAVEKLKAEAELLRDQLRLAVADSRNLERLMHQEVDNARVFSISGFARDLIPSFDNLEASLKNLSSDDSVHAGIKMTWDSLLSVLSTHGVKRIYPVGEQFDTRFHTAVTQAVANDKPSGTVLEVVQAGYILNGKVLRPASVVVSTQEGK